MSSTEDMQTPLSRVNVSRVTDSLLFAQVRDLMNWSADLRAAMQTKEKVRDAAGAQTLKAEHEAVKAEIEAREPSFRHAVELGETMIQVGVRSKWISSV